MDPEKGHVVAVAGASGLLGGELLRVLRDLSFPIDELRPIRDSAQEAVDADDREVEWEDEDLDLVEPGAKAYEGAEIAFLAGTPDDAGNAAKFSIARVPLSVDLSGRFSDNDDIPLVLSEVNDGALERLPRNALVAVPDAATAIVALALAPLHRALGIRRAVVTTYEAASGLGRPGMDELGKQIRALFNYQSAEPGLFPRPLAFNAVPQIDALEEDGGSRGERAMSRGLVRLLAGVGGASTPDVIATRAWVPVFSGHSASLTLETERPVARDAARAILEAAPGVELADDEEQYAVNGETVGGDTVSVGRVRTHGERLLSLWVTGDNLRRGAAIAAVKVAESVLARRG